LTALPTNAAWMTTVGIENRKMADYFDFVDIQDHAREVPRVMECRDQFIGVSSKLDGKAGEWHFELCNLLQG
jgi:hypothetical protein